MLQKIVKKMVGLERADALEAAVDAAKKKVDQARAALEAEQAKVKAAEATAADALAAFEHECTGDLADAVVEARSLLEKQRLFEQAAAGTVAKAERELEIAERAVDERELAKVSDECDPATVRRRVEATAAAKGPTLLSIVAAMLEEVDGIGAEARLSLRRKIQLLEKLGLDQRDAQAQLAAEAMAGSTRATLARVLGEMVTQREGGREARDWLRDL
jgi:hypothetical protein